jgi:low affinity Fe/Cu permease
MKERFRHIAEGAAHAVRTYWAFLLAFLVVVVWALTGPYFNYRTLGSWSSTPAQRSLPS